MYSVIASPSSVGIIMHPQAKFILGGGLYGLGKQIIRHIDSILGSRTLEVKCFEQTCYYLDIVKSPPIIIAN
jgi:hypothetical protein